MYKSLEKRSVKWAASKNWYFFRPQIPKTQCNIWTAEDPEVRLNCD